MNDAFDTARDDARAVAGAKRDYPHYLQRADVTIGDVTFRCWVDFEQADRSVGLPATAWLIHAHVGDSPVDIADFLSQSTIEQLEEQAAYYLSGGD